MIAFADFAAQYAKPKPAKKPLIVSYEDENGDVWYVNTESEFAVPERSWEAS